MAAIISLSPLATALILYYLLANGWSVVPQFAAAVLLGSIGAWMAFRVHFLSASGAVAMFLLALIIYGFGGLMWTIPILVFFILSSILSRIGKDSKSAIEKMTTRGSRRDAVQVAANGVIPGLILIAQIFSPGNFILSDVPCQYRRSDIRYLEHGNRRAIWASAAGYPYRKTGR